MASQVKHIPKDAQVIMSIMKDMGIHEYEQRVINQLLEFTYRYITCILDDARVFANHAKKKVIDLEDVKLAVQMTVDRAFTTPPPRDILLEVARTKNNTQLPFIKPHCGLRLPPDRYCLSSCNYKLRNNKKPQAKQVHHHSVGGGNAGFMNAGVSSHLTNINATGVKIQNKQQQQSLSIVKRPGTLTTVARTQAITIPKPVIRFSSGAPPPKQITKPKIQMTTMAAGNMPSPTIKIENDMSSGQKRKRDDGDYDLLE